MPNQKLTLALRAFLLVGALAVPGTAFAQSGETMAEPFIGFSIGYHDLGITDVDEDIVDDGGAIAGLVAGVDFPVQENMFVGFEFNMNGGSDAINNEYGASLRIGTRTRGGSKIYLRGGYQEVDVDVDEVFNADGSLVEVSAIGEDYLLGVGADLRAGPGNLRLNVDTIAFDTVRVTTGYVFSF